MAPEVCGQRPSIATIRPASVDDAATIATVHVVSWRESYIGLLPEAMLRRLSVADRTERWARILDAASKIEATSVFVAEREGNMVGFASGGAQRDHDLRAQGLTGEITALYVLQCAQRQNIGRRLLKAVGQALCDRGLHSASLWVFRDNQGARSFYDAMGGTVIAEKQDRREDVTLSAVAYTWPDLAVLSSSPGSGLQNYGD